MAPSPSDAALEDEIPVNFQDKEIIQSSNITEAKPKMLILTVWVWYIYISRNKGLLFSMH